MGFFMASGKKNYFRHSFKARKDPKLVGLIEDHGKGAYFHFFTIVEMCAEIASEEFPEDSKFIFRRSTLCKELLVTNSRLHHHLLAIQSSLLGGVLVGEKEVEIHLPNLAKYMGKYESKLHPNSSNKIKENKIKENKIKKNLPLVCNELLKIEEVENLADLESNILTCLNAISGSSYRPGKKTIALIRARIAEGFVFKDFKAVIESKCSEWKNTEWSKFLRPETLFGGKFEGYLQAAKNKPKTREENIHQFFIDAGCAPQKEDK